MTAVADLITTLAFALGLDRRDVAWIAERHLTRAGLLPEDAAIEPMHAARLLVAIMASARPLDAVDQLETYTALPARWRMMVTPSAAGNLCAWHAVEDLAIEPGSGHAFNILTMSIVSALTDLIDLAGQGVPGPPVVPRYVTISRDVRNSWAFLDCDVSVADQPPRRVTFVYGAGDEARMAYEIADLRLQLIGRTSGAIVRTLGALFADGGAAAASQQIKAGAPAPHAAGGA